MHYPEPVHGPKIRRRSESFKDYFSQAKLFYNSLSTTEKAHLIDAARFELGRVESPVIRQRMVALFDLVDRDLATRVAERIGIQPPTGTGIEIRDAAGELLQAAKLQPEPGRWLESSPSLSQLNTLKGSIKSRRVGVLLAPGFDADQFFGVKVALEAGGAHPDVVALGLGVVRSADGVPVPVDKSTQVAASVLYDAVCVPGGADHVAALAELDEVERFLTEAFKHSKPIGVVGEAAELLPAGVAGDGVIVGDASNPSAFAEGFVAAIGEHRFPSREAARGGIGGRRMP